MLLQDLSGRIKYLIQSEDLETAAEKIAGILEAKNRHIKKLAEIGAAQEKEIRELRQEIEDSKTERAFQLEQLEWNTLSQDEKIKRMGIKEKNHGMDRS